MIQKIKNLLFTECKKYRNIGLLLLRLGFGFIMLTQHGWAKLIGGPDKWHSLGDFGMSHIGITFLLSFFGFMASASESIGAIFIAIGLFFRPTSALLMITMLVGVNMHLATGKGNPEMAIIYALLSASFILIGPGKFSLDQKYFSKY